MFFPPEIMNRTNERGSKELYIERQHLKLKELRKMQISNGYLYNSYVPPYPQAVELNVLNLRHDTNLQGYHGIWNSEGFKKPTQSCFPSRDLVWWSPDISRHDISAAEKKYLREHEFDTVKPFLHKFTSSPAFLSSSRLGNFRFSMPVSDLFRSYQQQFCPGQRPHIRIFETVVYKQEVMYSFVIHSPNAQGLFLRYPLLRNTDNAVCELHDGSIIWRPQAMSKRHSHKLRDFKAIRIPNQIRKDYVWDTIGVAFHVPYGEIFSFSRDTLTKSLRLCKGAQPKIHTEEFVTCEFDNIRP